MIDSHELIVALEGHVLALGGTIALNTAARAVLRTEGGLLAIETESVGEHARITARNVVIAAGHGASTLGRTVAYKNGYRPPETYPAKGHYYALTGSAPFRRLIYPLPAGAWLGLHLTLDTVGRARFGPDIEWRETVTYEFEDDRGERRARFEKEIRRYWPGLPDGVLQPDYMGVRPKIYEEGEPAADFAVQGAREHGIPGLIALYGIESPGLTSCLAIGEHVAEALS